jgi:hypothetical protein
LELSSFISVRLNSFENFIARNWHDTPVFAIAHLN